MTHDDHEEINARLMLSMNLSISETKPSHPGGLASSISIGAVDTSCWSAAHPMPYLFLGSHGELPHMIIPLHSSAWFSFHFHAHHRMGGPLDRHFSLEGGTPG